MKIVYDKKAQRYRDSFGQFISHNKVRERIDGLTETFKKEAKKVSVKLADKQIDVDKWKGEMRQLIKSSHIVASSVGKGGHRQMNLSDWGKTGNEIKRQYKYLEGIAKSLVNLSDAEIARRAQLYGASINKSFYETLMKTQTGKVKRILHALDRSCDACVSWAGKFIPIAEMPPIGNLSCRSFCKCSLEFEV